MFWKRWKKTHHNEETKSDFLSQIIASEEFELSFTNRVEGLPWFCYLDTASKLATVISKVEFHG